MIRSDQLYEERAVDVVPDYNHQTLFKKSNGTGKIRNDKNNVAKMRHQTSGTIRSIPIKHYQASIAHSFGTLRKSDAPQLQFESSISEPERNATKYKPVSVNDVSFARNEADQLPRLTSASRYLEISNPVRRSCHSCDYQREVQSGSNKVTSKLKTLDRRIVKSDHNVSMREDQEFSDFEDYFYKTVSRRSTSNRQRSNDGGRATAEVNLEKMENGGTKRLNDEEVRVLRKWGTIDLERGHVGQKISAYEENARRSGRNWDIGENFQGFSESRKHRTIGVPLVGMHNACGLPVVASWHDHDLLEPLRVRGRVLGTLRPIFKAPRTPTDLRRRTHPKRRSSQRNRGAPRRNRTADSRNFDKRDDRPSIRSLVSLEAGGEVRKRRRRRSSFRTTKMGTISSKSSTKRSGRSEIRRNKENSVAGSLRGKLFEGNAKRQTLYARDDGDDAVQVLKTLCLNPLARTKPETDMIW